METIDPDAIYSREEFRELLQISKDKDRELRRSGNYPRFTELGARTIRILGRDIIAWLESNADDPEDETPRQSA